MLLIYVDTRYRCVNLQLVYVDLCDKFVDLKFTNVDTQLLQVNMRKNDNVQLTFCRHVTYVAHLHKVAC